MIPDSPFGYIPDPIDQRDWDYRFKMGPQRPMRTLVERLDWRSKVPEVLDQRSLGSCVSQAVLGAIRLKNVFDGINDPELGNRLHVYAGARSYIGTLDWDSGCHIRDALRFINSVGFMPESETVNKYNINKFTELPTPSEQRVMHDQKNKLDASVNYYRIYEAGASRKEALQEVMSGAGVPVLGTATTQEFLNYKSGILHRPVSTERQTGGHAFYLCGYTDDYAIGVNSWSDDWGLDGFFYLGWDWITWHETRDIWVVDKAPYFSHLKGSA